MRIKTRCPHCGKKLGGPPTLRGKSVKCSKCAKPFTVPADLVPEEPAPPAAQAASAEPEDELALEGLDDLNAPGAATPAGAPSAGAPLNGPAPWAHNTQKPGLASHLKTVAILLIVGALAYVGYTFYERQQKTDAANAKSEQEDDEKPTDEVVPIKKSKPVLSAQSRVVVINQRFPQINVFGPGGKLGVVPFGETKSFDIKVPKGGESFKLSYEVLGLPRGIKLPQSVEKQLSDGLPFTAPDTKALKVTFIGPPPDFLPEPGFRFKTVAADDATFDPGIARALVKKVLYKENQLLPALGAKTLQLDYKKDGRRHLFFWVAQDCIIKDAEGKLLYDPAKHLWRTEDLPLTE